MGRNLVWSMRYSISNSKIIIWKMNFLVTTLFSWSKNVSFYFSLFSWRQNITNVLMIFYLWCSKFCFFWFLTTEVCCCFTLLNLFDLEVQGFCVNFLNGVFQVILVSSNFIISWLFDNIRFLICQSDNLFSFN